MNTCPRTTGTRRPSRSLAAAIVLMLACSGAQARQCTRAVDYANAGVTSSIVASCLEGSFTGGDRRGCSGAVPETPSKAGNTLSGWGWATFSNGVSTQASGQAAFGTLGAYAESDVPTSADIFLNTQSRGASSLSDFIVSSNASGGTSNTYQYTIVVSGAMSPQVGFYRVFPYGYASVYAGFNTSPINCFGCAGVIANWSSESGGPTGTVDTGTFTVPVGTSFQMRASLDVSSYINTFPGQSASVIADYAGGMRMYLDALTPGANTIGVSGYDYAMAMAVPEPGTPLLLLSGLAALLLRGRRRLVEGAAPTVFQGVLGCPWGVLGVS